MNLTDIAYYAMHIYTIKCSDINMDPAEPVTATL